MSETEWDGTEWDDDDALPRFGRAAREWFRRRVRSRFFEKPAADGSARCLVDRRMWPAETIQFFLGRFEASVEDYVEWVDSPEWHGPRFANGAWQLLDAKLEADANRVMVDVDKWCDSRFKTLDEWLAADLHGQLEYDGDEGGMSRLPAPVRAELAARRRARRRKATKEKTRWCRECGAPFPVEKNAKRCPDCRRGGIDNPERHAPSRRDNNAGQQP